MQAILPVSQKAENMPDAFSGVIITAAGVTSFFPGLLKATSLLPFLHKLIACSLPKAAHSALPYYHCLHSQHRGCNTVTAFIVPTPSLIYKFIKGLGS